MGRCVFVGVGEGRVAVLARRFERCISFVDRYVLRLIPLSLYMLFPDRFIGVASVRFLWFLDAIRR